ncbi:hypothetical protein [Aliarcobacter butzleri]|uniref:hypothetical protein n=1 Tax=Aliarcobacter butzleri TaxID=28197 RepID=UPI0021B1EA61|nr:hypothetical protein [Aliarcobacter butzleri]MCT7536420.1 hypothetical protein [Aliarcobacter butzleri]MCT7623384.1 hypothetical protein [Aliarcobacter butzleri]
MNIRCTRANESGNFLIIDDNKKMITEISEEIIELIYNLKYFVNKNIAISCTDAINFYNGFIEYAIKNKIETNNDKNYSKSHILTSDFNLGK